VKQTDLSVGGRGPALGLTRTYNSLLAAKQTTSGPFGYGWTSSYSAHLVFKTSCQGLLCREIATVHEDNGSTITFTDSAAGWNAPLGLVEATLASEGSGYVYTLPDQIKMEFNSEGRLIKETDRNGNVITLAYNAEKQLESATDSAGRKLTFKYNDSGEVESATDPMGHAVKYTYDPGTWRA
jgi:YD repeat-containing protein